MSAIGVDRVIIHFLGGWKRGSSTMERDYIDPTVMPTPAAFMLYGWALARQYSVGTGSIERAVPMLCPCQTHLMATSSELADCIPALVQCVCVGRPLKRSARPKWLR